MRVEVIREKPIKQPITEVILHLPPEDANLLRNMFGRLSRAKIKHLWDGKLDNDCDDVVDEIFNFTSGVYNAISEEMKK